MTNLPYQPAESHKSAPEDEVLSFVAMRFHVFDTGEELLLDAVANNEANNSTEIDLSNHYKPSVPVGRLVTEHMDAGAQTMGSVINLAERQAAVQKQQPTEQSLWGTVVKVPAQPTNMDVEAWETYVNSLARSKGEIDLNDDIKKAA